jgi:putative ABC transport system permease protein
MPLLDTFWQDARRGARALAMTPGVTLTALLTLGLGIGANTAIFTVVNAVLLRPLPYAEPASRVMLWSKWKGFDKTWVSAGELLDYRTCCSALAEVAAWSGGQVNLTGDGDPMRVGAAEVTPNTFRVLGAEPIPGLGRTFTAAEDVAAGWPAAIISHGLWQRRYGGDPHILGRTIQIDGRSVPIVGVMPKGFRLPTDFGEDAAEPTELWVPMHIDPKEAVQERGNHGLYAAARLAPGATAAVANAQLAAVTAAWTERGLYSREMQFTAFVVPVADEILGGVRPAMLLLTGAVVFLLLIACANVASLLLARAEARQREIAVRSALGAGHWRLVRQLLTESVVLAAVSGALGLALAVGGLRLLLAIDPLVVPRADTVGIDGRVLVFTVGLSLLTTLLFSIAPALRAVKLDLTDALKEGGRQGSTGVRAQRFRDMLVVVEMALGVVLVIGAVLMVRSLWALQKIDLGFEPAHVLTARLSVPESAYTTNEQVMLFYDRLVQRVRTLPDVRAAGIVRSLPLANTIGDWGMQVEGYTEPPGLRAKGDWQVVSDGAFEAMGERLVRGRFFSPTDTAASPPVAIINETMARMYWLGRDPIGGRFRMGRDSNHPQFTVVGVVGNVRHNGIEAPVKEKFYVPHSQFHLGSSWTPRDMTLVVRTAGEPAGIAPALRGVVREIDRNVPVANIRPMTDVVETALATPRLTGWLLALFAALALVLSAVGIYGVLAYLVTQRTHEIGIRLAIGADTAHVLRLVLGRGLLLSVAGVAIGLIGAAFLTSLIATQLHDVVPHDAMTFAGVSVVMILVALAACYIPAWRATRVDPLQALRVE